MERKQKPGIYLKNHNGSFSIDGRQKLYVVLNRDDGKWYEYFSGVALNVVTGGSWAVFSDDLLGIMKTIDADNIKDLGHRSFSISNPSICDALSFSVQIKSYHRLFM